MGDRLGRVRVGQVRRALRGAQPPHRLADQRQLPAARQRGFCAGPCDNSDSAAEACVWTPGTTYPGNFGSGFGAGAGTLTATVNWQLDTGADVEAWAKQYANNGGYASTENWPAEFSVKEKDSAAYGMVNLAGSHWRGNVGLRLVRTDQASLSNVSNNDPNVVLTPADNSHGLYTPTLVEHTFTDLFLPSANFKFDLNRDLVARVAIARTMARADYSALATAVSLDDTLHTGSGGNPDLKPVRSTNYDGTLESGTSRRRPCCRPACSTWTSRPTTSTTARRRCSSSTRPTTPSSRPT